MNKTIPTVWASGLIGALLLTLVILKQVSLLIRALQGIHQLAEYTREAARGIATNAAAGSKLGDAATSAGQFHEATGALAAAVAALQQRLDTRNGVPAGRVDD